jgi:hypothetical protein
LLPAAALAATAWAGEGGARGLFHADVAALVLAAAVGAWGAAGRRALLALPASAVAAGVVHAAFARSPEDGGAMALLVLGVGVAASGLASVSRALGAPAAAGGAVAASVLWAAMVGLSWADDVAESLPQERRGSFRQAVLHADPATAAAYGAARFDRLHDLRVYETVPLASSMIEPPAAWTTGASWAGVGLALWFGTVALGRRRSLRTMGT